MGFRGECAALCWLLCLLASEAQCCVLSFKSFRRERKREIRKKKKKKPANWRENTWTFTFGWQWAGGETLAQSAAVREAVFLSTCLLALAPHSWNSADNHPTVSQCQWLLASWNGNQRPDAASLTKRRRRQKMWKTQQLATRCSLSLGFCGWCYQHQNSVEEHSASHNSHLVSAN